MNDYFKIWQKAGKVNNNQLLNYLNNELNEADKHAVEDQLINSSFESDAVDGLLGMPPQQIQQTVNHLNNRLQKMLSSKKKYTRKQSFNIQTWVLLALITVLVIALSAYGLLHMMHH